MSDKPILNLTIPIPPSVNNDYMKPRGILKYKNGKPLAMAMMYECGEAKKFKRDMIKLINEEIKKQEYDTTYEKSFVICEFTFFFPRINMDSNNYYKVFIDSITQSESGIWIDDNISMIKDNRIYYDSKNPRVEVKIYPAPYVGIFDNKSEYELFLLSFCNKCSKDSNKCSIHKKALESRVQDDLDITDKICKKFKEKNK